MLGQLHEQKEHGFLMVLDMQRGNFEQNACSFSLSVNFHKLQTKHESPNEKQKLKGKRCK